MYITEDVNLPQPLIEAQSNRTLVIFAGAGVSAASPSSLPDFKKLAKKVAEEAGRDFRLQKHEPIDRFLGRISSDEVDVHQAVVDLIIDSNTRPNALHKSILSLFQSADGNGDLEVRRLLGRYKSAAPLGYSRRFKGMGPLDLPGGNKGCIAIWSNGHEYV